MKAFILSVALTTSATFAQSGGPWTITSATFDGGGASSTGGEWKVTGTIGQPDASTQTSTGGGWTVAGGFWPGAITAPGGPLLAVVPHDPYNVYIVWKAAAVGYKLQTSTDLAAWTDYPNGTISGPGYIVWPLRSGPRYFFRLIKL